MKYFPHPTNAPDNRGVTVSFEEVQRTAAGRKKRHREPIRQERKFIVMALILVVGILAGTLWRVIDAASYVTYEDIVNFNGVTCRITDRFGGTIYEEGAVGSYQAFGNLIGHREHMHNTLLYRHADKLRSDNVNALIGHASLETLPRVMNTTLLPEESQKELAAMFKNKSGCLFAYNYETGEVYSALSLPAYDPNSDQSSFINNCFQQVYIPGSTMKIITAALAVDQGLNVQKLTFTCNRTYKLSDGYEVVCAGYHGSIGFSAAIGMSCNCYFAQLIERLNLDKALDTLKEMGFAVNGAQVPEETVDGLTKEHSSVSITNTASFNNVWGLIGQGKTQVNVIDMARLAAAVANGGKAADPYIVTSIVNPNQGDAVIHEPEPDSVRLLSEKTADTTAQFWKAGVDAHYYGYHSMSRSIDYAKTGTAEQGDRTNDQLLIGVIESAKTAFCIVVEKGNYDPAPMTIANRLAQLLPQR